MSSFPLAEYESMMEVPAGHYIGGGQRSKTPQMVRPSPLWGIVQSRLRSLNGRQCAFRGLRPVHQELAFGCLA